MDDLTIQGRRVTLRPLAESDLPRMVEIISHPEIEQWWTYHDEARLHRELFEDATVVPYAIEFDGSVIGVIEYTEEQDPDYRSAGIDIVLDAEWVNRGLGTDALAAMARHLFEVRGHHRLTIDPAVANARAIAAYAKVGFRPVGVMRMYERAGTGEWRDSLLMDMLNEDLER